MKKTVFSATEIPSKNMIIANFSREVRYFHTSNSRRTTMFINNQTFFVLVINTDKDLEDKMNQMWDAIYNLQQDIDKLMYPNKKTLFIPKMKTEEAMRSGLRRAVDDGRKSESFLTPTKRIPLQTSIDTWTTKKHEEWSDVQWELWAKDIYKNYPEARQYLPDWFIKYIERH